MDFQQSVITQQQVELEQSKKSVDTLAKEISTLRRDIEKLSSDLNSLHRISALRPTVTPRRGWRHRTLHKIGQALAKRTAYPLARTEQYPPRPLRYEEFPPVSTRNKLPRICLITPSYQQAAFLERTIHSVVSQGYPCLAYGVQDGGSTDGSIEVIQKHIACLAHAESTRDHGQGDAIRRGFAKLYPEPGHIMAWLNSDDLLMPGALNYVGGFFADHPEVDVIYGHRVIIDESDQEVARWYLPRHNDSTLALFDLVPQETVFWRAEAYERIGGIDPTYQFALDWDLLLRFQEAGLNIRRLPYFLGCFRTHPNQKTSASIATIGEPEMTRLRRRTHGRDVHPIDIERHLDTELSRSAITEWLHRHGIRY